MVSALVAATAVAFTLPVTPPAVRALDDARAARIAGRRGRSSKRPGVLALMFAGGLIQGSHAVLYSFGSIYWQKLGLTTAEIGAFWAIGVICEIGVFMWSGPRGEAARAARPRRLRRACRHPALDALPVRSRLLRLSRRCRRCTG